MVCIMEPGGQQGSVGIVRVSGMNAFDMLPKVFRRRGERPPESWEPKSHRVYYGEAIDPGGAVLDEVCNHISVVVVTVICVNASRYTSGPPIGDLTRYNVPTNPFFVLGHLSGLMLTFSIASLLH